MNRDDPAFPHHSRPHAGLTKGELELILYRCAITVALAKSGATAREILDMAIAIQRAAIEAEKAGS